MFGQITYIVWLILFIGLPTLLLFVWQPRALWRQRRTLRWTVVGAFVGGWAWDALAVQLGAWYYREEHILNIWIGGLPIEEWLWIVGVTVMFAALTVILVERRQPR